MNFETYEKSGHLTYADLASTVASILDVLVKELPDVRVQQIQHRAKSAASLKKKILERSGSLERDVEKFAKDVAGCRLIFYTNDDVARFIKSRLMWDNFDIDWDRTKFHYPLDEKSGEGLFISYNYVVKLKEQRTSLPEYAELADKWCEIQVQTILDHAWSEMHHDTGYKPPDGGFGTAVLKDVNARMAKIMQDHLFPAGFDFQKVSDDVRRLQQARELYESKPLELACGEINNNDRDQLLKRFREEVLPYFDDIAAEADGIRRVLRTVIEVAGRTPYEPLRYATFETRGATFGDVVASALGIVDQLRYSNEGALKATWDFAGEAYDVATSDEERERALKTIETLAKHNMTVWKQVGPWAQVEVAKMLADAATLPPRRAIVTRAASAILNPEVNGTTNSFATVTFHQGAVTPSEQLATARATALKALETLLVTADASDQMTVFEAMMNATRFPHMANYGETLIELVIANALDVVAAATRLAPQLDMPQRATVERNLFNVYRQGGGVTEANESNAALVELRDRLLADLMAFRDAVNGDEAFVIHKTLVGFDNVSPLLWQTGTWDFEAQRQERSEAIDQLVDQLSSETYNALLPHLLYAASVKSNDGATFIAFDEFLEKVGRRKPDVALRLLNERQGELGSHLHVLLKGVAASVRAEDGLALMRQWISERKHLREVLAHCERTNALDLSLFEECAATALDGDDVLDLLNLTSVAARIGRATPTVLGRFYVPAVRKVAVGGDRRWINYSYFLWSPEFVGHLNEADIDELLELGFLWSRIGTHEEWVLAEVARLWPLKVIMWLGRRVELANTHGKADGGYEAIPFQFYRLNEALQAHGSDLVSQVRTWFIEDDATGFEYTGGRTIRQVFPEVTPIETHLRGFATGSDTDRDFLVRVLAAYDGSTTIDGLCRDLIEASEANSPIWGRVEMAFDSMGVVSGDFGMVEAHVQRRDALTSWLSDDREKVRRFAESHILDLDRQIAAERRRSMEDLHLRMREYGEA